MLSAFNGKPKATVFTYVPRDIAFGLPLNEVKKTLMMWNVGAKEIVRHWLCQCGTRTQPSKGTLVEPVAHP